MSVKGIFILKEIDQILSKFFEEAEKIGLGGDENLGYFSFWP